MYDGRVRPPCSWPGGKANFAPAIAAKFAKPCKTYVEPYLGMGAVLLYLLDTGVVTRARVADLDPSVCTLWTAIKQRPRDVARALHALCVDASEDAFYRVRDAQNAHAQDSVEHAARMIYLSKLAFGGVFRRNRLGALNMPYGKGKRIVPESVDYFERLSVLLRDVDIMRADGVHVIASVERGDWCYADPPYAGAHGYGGAEWTVGHTSRVVDALNRAACEGAQCVFSEHDRPEIRALLPQWNVEAVNVSQRIRRMNTLDGSARGTRNEIIAWR